MNDLDELVDVKSVICRLSLLLDKTSTERDALKVEVADLKSKIKEMENSGL